MGPSQHLAEKNGQILWERVFNKLIGVFNTSSTKNWDHHAQQDGPKLKIIKHGWNMLNPFDPRGGSNLDQI